MTRGIQFCRIGELPEILFDGSGEARFWRSEDTHKQIDGAAFILL
ncbi:MAG TPA: hypothetical protein VN442_11105 [Bryobacteraceae bacterium]|nr:hypothetical protein [Bryobacteraceae bacterium]